jgi:hypothetical protein
MNRLSMEERTLITGLLRLGWSERRIALETQPPQKSLAA